VDKALRGGARASGITQRLAKAAFEASIDRKRVTPYSRAATEAFDMVYSGGKKVRGLLGAGAGGGAAQQQSAGKASCPLTGRRRPCSAAAMRQQQRPKNKWIVLSARPFPGSAWRCARRSHSWPALA
jgi:hypothetical protein